MGIIYNVIVVGGGEEGGRVGKFSEDVKIVGNFTYFLHFRLYYLNIRHFTLDDLTNKRLTLNDL
jgi:hypothetical protein